MVPGAGQQAKVQLHPLCLCGLAPWRPRPLRSSSCMVGYQEMKLVSALSLSLSAPGCHKKCAFFAKS
jgi:hypothetical protein